MATQPSTSHGGTGLPAGVVEELLADETRRLALEILAEYDEPMVVASLARAVLTRRDDCAATDVSTDACEALREELFTDHIPKLTATGVLEYDSMLGTVTLQRPDIVT